VSSSLRGISSRVTALLLVTIALAGCGSTPAPTLQSIEVTPGAPSLAKGTSTQLAATARYSDGTTVVVTNRSTWASATTSVAPVGATGLVAGATVGSSEVSATFEQVTGRVTVTVGPPVPAGIEVTPNPATVPLGLTASFQASRYIMTDGTNAPFTGAVTWSSQGETVATVDASGVAQSRAQGTATIRATQGAVSGTASLTVGPPVPAAIAVFPTSVTVFPGRSHPFTATATMTDGTSTDVTSSATWSSSDPAVVRMEGSVAWNEGRGTATVRASLGALSATATMQAIPQRFAFVTSGRGTADLGTWATAGGKVGLEAGDAICQSAARAGRLPGTYRAFLSGPRDDAYCRVHGLTGTVAGKCGQATLPASAGPWLRTDGTPYAARIDGMVNGETYYPLAFDEFGSEATGWGAFTGSDYAGVRSVGEQVVDCSGWTSSTVSGIASGAYASMTSFAVGSGGLICPQVAALICFEVADGEGAALPPRDATGKLAFLTSVQGPGMLAAWSDAGAATGIAAGDAICRARATAVGFRNAERFKAWLSDETTSAVDRITSNGPWVRPDGVLVASTKAVLVSGNLVSSITVTETGLYANWVPGVSLPGSWTSQAWTGTEQSGVKTDHDCFSWSAPVFGTGISGSTILTTSWSHLVGMDPLVCSRVLPIYCLED